MISKLPPPAQAAVGALLIGLGFALMVGAARAIRPCEDCEEDALESIDDIAAASAEMNGSDD